MPDIAEQSMNRALRFPEVRKITGLSRSTIWRLESTGHFPRRFLLTNRSIAWWSDEVDKWLAERRNTRMDVTSQSEKM